MAERKGPKKASLKDWHRADIKSALEKAGWNLSSLSLHHGYEHRNTLQTALQRPWPKGERLIASAIGIDPATIWPARYANHHPTRGLKDSTLQGVLNQSPNRNKQKAA